MKPGILGFVLRTRVKICGITSVTDAGYVVRHGADALGLVFYDKSPRHVSIEQARDIIAAVPAFVTSVALFVDADPDYIESVLRQVPIDLIQFHGQETPQQCERYERPYIKALSMRADTDLHALCDRYQLARALLVDSYRPGIPGGTGEVFDWDRIPAQLDKPLVLAGGLNSDNIVRAIETVRPFAVDVSSGVELNKGIKDEGKIESFIRGVQSVKHP